MLMTAKGVSKSVEDSCVCVLKLYIFFRNFVVEIFIENQVIYTVFKGGFKFDQLKNQIFRTPQW